MLHSRVMSEMTQSNPSPDVPAALLHTATGTRTHLPACPHLRGTHARAATTAVRLRNPVCDWSMAQIGGYGREHFDTVEDALRRVGVPVGADKTIRTAMRFVEYDEVFVVHSLTYGALAAGGRTVAGFGKSYYWVGDQRINLPSYSEGVRTGHTTPLVYGEICQVHFIAMNLLGICDDC
jgi:hypothetical protein